MNRRRRGFTLVEILVALALTLFILAILSECFVTGADTFRTLKAIGDMNSSLRSATDILRADLAGDHFEGKRRVSDVAFWTAGPPEQGYFYLYQGPPPGVAGADPSNVDEGTDPDGLPARRRVSHKLAFTVRAKGTRPQDFFTAKILDPASPLLALGNPSGRYQTAGGNLFSTQWMEVTYFLVPVQGARADGTPLYALYRQQRLIVSDNNALNWGAAAGRVQATAVNLASYPTAVSCLPNPTNGTFLYFNSPGDLTIPERRTAGAFVNAAGAYLSPALFTPLGGAQPTGDDLLLTGVISFDVKVLTKVTSGTALATDSDFGDLPNPTQLTQNQYYFYDTWSRRRDLMGPTATAYDYALKTTATGNPFAKPIPMAASGTTNPTYRIVALQITLRVWDPRTKLARQISFVQGI
jgi:prepilin-type N-terminal cleavage/methylation domain-containing protein